MKMTPLRITALTIACITLGIRILGLLRDGLIASEFGVGSGVDDFFLLLGWAHFLTSVFATSAINQTVPLIKSQDLDDPGLPGFIAGLLLNFLVGLFSVGMIIFMVFSVTTDFSSKIILASVYVFIFQSLNHFLTSILNLRGRFLAPASLFVFPVLSTLFALLVNNGPATDLIIAFLIGCVGQFLILLKAFQSMITFRGFFQKIVAFKNSNFFLKWTGLAVATCYFPASELLNIQLSGFLDEGAVSMLSYSGRIPLAIANLVVFAVWTVALPNMQTVSSSFLSRQDFLRVLRVAGGSLLIAMVCWVASPMMVMLIYGYGDGIESSVLNDIIDLQRLLLIALPLQVTVNLVLRFMHANGWTRTSITFSFAGLAVQGGFFWFGGFSTQSVAMAFILNFTTVLGLCMMTSIRQYLGSTKPEN